MRKTVNMARVSEAALYLFMAFGVEKRRGWVFSKPRTGPDSTAALLKSIKIWPLSAFRDGTMHIQSSGYGIGRTQQSSAARLLLGLGMVQHMLGQTASSLLGTN